MAPPGPGAPEGEALTPLQSAVYLLKQAQAKLAALESEPIAVIGMGNRFPGDSDTPEAFWRLLCGGVDAVGEVPADRWSIDDYYDPDPAAPGKMNSRFGGFLAAVDGFDADFFGISPREAVRVDPQQRLLLEVAWEALEDAGLAPDRLEGTRAGVFVGVIGSDYALLQSQNPSDMDIFSGTGASHAILANRLSYVLNLTGPSVTLDTACSSALVAVHLACQSLRRREADVALAGGVNLILGPDMSLALTKAHMLAPDGRCKTFDAAANGYVRGEGCGLVVLKRLRDALADRDRIAAVIRGSAVNHDGRSNGLSAPSGPAQEAVLRGALANARLEPREIDYVEAHGTGTRLGDPIEISALQAVLGAGRPADRGLVVGSVKTNIGHLESAAGVAGLIKVILMLQHEEIPPHLHLRTPNPLLELERSCITIPTRALPWPRRAEPRRAGVSSFGFGGTNAHVIVEEAPADPPPPAPGTRPLHLHTVSARSAAALAELAGRHAARLRDGTGELPGDLAFTANTGRSRFAHRAAVVGATREDLARGLEALRDGGEAAGLLAGALARETAPRIAFLFTGQGCQYPGMGRVLYRTQPAFKAALDRCAGILRPWLEVPLVELLEQEDPAVLARTGTLQPVLFSLQYALAEVWRSWGVVPAAVLGHSVGELAAACVAGVFSLEDGLRLTATRARLMQELPAGGAMAAVLASEARVVEGLKAVAAPVSIAALNAPEVTVIAGAGDDVRAALARFAAQGVSARPLATSHAFHSALMDPVLCELEAVARTVTFRPPTLEIVSNLSGQCAGPATFAQARYWARHAREPVRFQAGLQTLAGRGIEVFLELGPSATLIGLGQRCLPDGKRTWLPSLRPRQDDWQTMLGSLSRLFVAGAEIDWQGFDRSSPRRRVGLPSYPFQRKRYWLPEPTGAAAPGPRRAAPEAPGTHPLLGPRLPVATLEAVFETRLAADRPGLLAEHKVQGTTIVPGAAYLELALAASAAVHGRPWVVRELAVLEPLVLEGAPRTVQTLLAPEGPAAAGFRIVSLEAGAAGEAPGIVLHASGRLEAAAGPDGPAPVDLAALRARFAGEARDAKWQREALRKSGLDPGPGFTWITRHWVEGREALGELRLEREGDQADRYVVHPGLADCLFQLLGATHPEAGGGVDAYVPVGVDRVEVRRPPRGPTLGLATCASRGADLLVGSVRLYDAAGNLAVLLDGVELRRVPRDWMSRLTAGKLPEWLCRSDWVPQPFGPGPGAPAAAGPGRWLVAGSGDGLCEALVRELEAAGQHCTVVPAGCGSAATRAAVLDFLGAGALPPRGIVHLPGAAPAGPGGAPDFAAARAGGWGGVLDLVHAWGAAAGAPPVRLWLVTRGAQAVGPGRRPLALAEAPVWGLGRVIAAEHPDLAPTRIDLDPGEPGVELLARELLAPGPEDEIAFRAGERLVARLRQVPRGRMAAGKLEPRGGRPYRVEITARGELENVEARELVRRAPGPGEVEILVRSTGLNFRDVLNVLNLYPGDPGPLGGECAGEVVAVGAGVTRFGPGDDVVALAPASFASHVLTREEFVARKPARLSHDQAAGLPICFLTVQHALHHLGGLRAGQRVLIHTATGGVGLAAIQLARRAGAEIFATAGSPAKREHLAALGIEHVYSSRSTGFAAAILAATGGRGVDLVLNTLTGETIAASLSLLKGGGHFLELGKTDLWDQARVDAVQPGARFHAIALDGMMAGDPGSVEGLMAEVMARFEAGELEALPVRTYPLARMVEALRFMARAEHIGKLVIQAAAPARERAFSLAGEATYLVTGGLGGLGLEVARWLADRGAKQLVLVGRSKPSEAALRRIEGLAEAGARVFVRPCDLGQRSEVEALLAGIAAELPPLKGIFHLAGVLDDGALRDQTRERFDRVLAPKALGAWHLHALTRDLPLEHFVLFSSAAALLGSPGQANYAAANAFLDALAHQRRFEGLPALSVNWGSWDEVGMAARLKETEGRRWAASGLGWIDPPRGIRLLEQLVLEDPVQMGVLPIDWGKFFQLIPAGREPGRFSELAKGARAPGAGEESGPPALLEELGKVTPGERLEVALAALRRQAARVLAMDDGSLPDPRRMLNELGFDSLVGVEFCNRVGRSIGKRISPTVLFEHPTLEKLATHVVRDLLRLETAAAPEAAPAPAPGPDDQARLQALAEVEGMSEAEMSELVDSHLGRL